MPNSVNTQITRRQRENNTTPDEGATRNEDQVYVEDPCEQAARLSEIEYLRSQIHQKNLFITQLSSQNKSLINDREKYKYQLDECENVRTQVANLEQTISNNRKLNEDSYQVLLRENISLNKEINALKVQLADSVSSSAHTAAIEKFDRLLKDEKQASFNALQEKNKEVTYFEEQTLAEVNQIRDHHQKELQEAKAEADKIRTEFEQKAADEKKEQGFIKTALQQRISNNAKSLLEVRQELQTDHQKEIDQLAAEHRTALEELRREHRDYISKRDQEDERTNAKHSKLIADARAELRKEQENSQASKDKLDDVEQNHKRAIAQIQKQCDKFIKDKHDMEKLLNNARVKLDEQATQHKLDLISKERSVNMQWEPQNVHLQNQLADLQRVLERVKQEHAAALENLRNAMKNEANALSAEKQAHLATRSAHEIEIHELRNDVVQAKLEIEKKRVIENQLVNEQKRVRTLEYDHEAILQELKDSHQFIQQQEERYSKSRAETIELYKKLQEFKNFYDQQNAKYEYADEAMAEADKILREAKELAVKKRGQISYTQPLIQVPFQYQQQAQVQPQVQYQQYNAQPVQHYQTAAQPPQIRQQQYSNYNVVNAQGASPRRQVVSPAKQYANQAYTQAPANAAAQTANQIRVQGQPITVIQQIDIAVNKYISSKPDMPITLKRSGPHAEGGLVVYEFGSQHIEIGLIESELYVFGVRNGQQRLDDWITENIAIEMQKTGTGRAL